MSDLNYELKMLYKLKCNMWKKVIIHLFKYNFIQDADALEFIRDFNKPILEPMYKNDTFVMALEDASREFEQEFKEILKDHQNGDMDKYII
jgi:hypothetical protein